MFFKLGRLGSPFVCLFFLKSKLTSFTLGSFTIFLAWFANLSVFSVSLWQEADGETAASITVRQFPPRQSFNIQVSAYNKKKKKSITDLRHFYTTTIPDSSYAHTKTIPKRTVVHRQETVILVCFANLCPSVNGCSGRSGSKWVGARTETHWTGSKYSKVRIEIKCTKLSPPTAPYDVWCVCTTCFTFVPLPFVLYRTALHVGTENYPA